MIQVYRGFRKNSLCARRFAPWLVVAWGLMVLALPQSSLAFTNTKLSDPFAAVDGDVQSFQFSPDGTRIVYLADQDTNGVAELYSVKSDGSESPIKLNTTSSRVYAFLITPDSSRVVYRSAQDTAGVIELYSRRIDGIGGAVKLNGPLVANGNVGPFLISADSARVVYRADQEVDSRFELYSRPVDGSGAATKLNGSLVSGGDVQTPFLISPDSSRVVYLADQQTNNKIELFVRPIDGSGSATKLNGALQASGDVEEFQISADSTHVVYSADQDTDRTIELYARAIDGSGSATKLNDPLAGDVSRFRIMANGYYVVFIAGDPFADDLYLSAIDGSFRQILSNPYASKRIEEFAVGSQMYSLAVVYDVFDYDSFEQVLYGPSGNKISSGEAVGDFLITPDDTRVVYAASSGLFVQPVYGPGPPVELATASLHRFLVSPDSTEVVFSDYHYDDYGSATLQLYSQLLSGAGSPVLLNGTLPAGGEVADFAISPTSGRVAYLADQNEKGVFELFTRPIDGSGSSIRLNGPLAIGGTVETDLQFTPDGSRVVYRANRDTEAVDELFTRRMDGSGGNIKLSTPGSGATDFVLSLDGTHAVWRGNAESLFTTTTDGSSPVVQLDDSKAITSYRVSPDGTKAVFLAHPPGTYEDQLYSRSLDGSGSPVVVTGPLPYGFDIYTEEPYAITADSSRVVYVAAYDGDAVAEVYVRPIDGSGTATKLSSVDPGGYVASLQLSADGLYVIYIADQDGSGTQEVYSRPVDGSGTSIKLSDAAASSGRVEYFMVSPDGARAVYVVYTPAGSELYSRRTDGSGVSVRLSDPGSSVDYYYLPDDYIDRPFKISRDSAWVVYRTNESHNEVFASPIDGSGAAVRLSRASENGSRVENPTTVHDEDPIWYLISPDSMRVVFIEHDTGIARLYSAPIDGSAEPSSLSGDLLELDDFNISANSTRVVYSGDEGQVLVELYSRPIDGSGVSTKESGTLIGFQELTGFAISPDSQHLVYVATQSSPGDYELWSSLRCGDALPDAGEACDDGNVSDGDCCSSVCAIDNEGLSCGAGTCAPQSCSAGTCIGGGTTPVCGDGFAALACGETCDDGGTTSGDGCADGCQLEGLARKCLQAIGLQARRVAVQDLKLTQGCLDDVARGNLGCQTGQCVLRPSSSQAEVIAGSSCTTAADCCPAFDNANPSKSSAGKAARFAASTASRVRAACSLAPGVDAIPGNDDDVYLDPQTFGFASTCPDTFGHCTGIATNQLHATGVGNDLLDCTQCVAASTSYGLLRAHYPLAGATESEVECQRAIGLQTNKLAGKELTLQQKCLDRVARGDLTCQSNQCALGADAASPVVAGSVCSVAADCCPVYDSADSTKSTRAKLDKAAASAAKEMRESCSLARGPDHVYGTDDDSYVDPQTLGYADMCPAIFGACASTAIANLTTAGTGNDLVECVACGAGSAADTYSHFHAAAQ